MKILKNKIARKSCWLGRMLWVGLFSFAFLSSTERKAYGLLPDNIIEFCVKALQKRGYSHEGAKTRCHAFSQETGDQIIEQEAGQQSLEEFLNRPFLFIPAWIGEKEWTKPKQASFATGNWVVGFLNTYSGGDQSRGPVIFEKALTYFRTLGEASRDATASKTQPQIAPTGASAPQSRRPEPETKVATRIRPEKAYYEFAREVFRGDPLKKPFVDAVKKYSKEIGAMKQSVQTQGHAQSQPAANLPEVSKAYSEVASKYLLTIDKGTYKDYYDLAEKYSEIAEKHAQAIKRYGKPNHKEVKNLQRELTQAYRKLVAKYDETFVSKAGVSKQAGARGRGVSSAKPPLRGRPDIPAAGSLTGLRQVEHGSAQVQRLQGDLTRLKDQFQEQADRLGKEKAQAEAALRIADAKSLQAEGLRQELARVTFELSKAKAQVEHLTQALQRSKANVHQGVQKNEELVVVIRGLAKEKQTALEQQEAQLREEYKVAWQRAQAALQQEQQRIQEENKRALQEEQTQHAAVRGQLDSLQKVLQEKEAALADEVQKTRLALSQASQGSVASGNLKEEVQFLTVQLANVRKESERLSQAEQVALEKLREVTEKAQEADQQLRAEYRGKRQKALRDQRQLFEQEISRLGQQHATDLAEKLQEAQAAYQRAIKEHQTRAQAELEQSQAQVRQIQEELQQLKSQSAQDKGKATATSEASAEELRELTAELQAARSELTRKAQELKQIKDTADKFKTESSAEKHILKLKEQAALLMVEKYQAANSEFEGILNNERAVFQAELTRVNAENEKRVHEAQEKERQTQAKLQALKQKSVAKHSENSQLSTQQAERIAQLEAELAQERESREQQEVALRQSQALVQKQQEDHAAQISNLTDAHDRKLAEQQKSHEEQVNELKEEWKRVKQQALKSAEIAQLGLKELQLRFDKQAEELKSEKQKAEEALQIAYESSNTSEALETHVRSLDQQLKQAKQTSRELGQESEKLKQEKAILEERLRSANAKATDGDRKYEQAVQRFESELAREKLVYQNKVEQLQELNKSRLDEAQAEAAEYQRELAELKKLLSSQASQGTEESELLKQQVQKLEQNLKTARENLKKKKGELAESQERFGEAHEAVLAENSNLRVENARLVAQSQLEQERNKVLEAHQQELQTRYESQLQEERTKLEGAERSLQKLQDLYKEKEKELAAEKKKVKEAQSHVQAGSEESDKLVARLASLEQQLEQAHETSQELQQQSEILKQEKELLDRALKDKKANGDARADHFEKAHKELAETLARERQVFDQKIELLKKTQEDDLRKAQEKVRKTEQNLAHMQEQLRSQQSHGEQQSAETEGLAKEVEQLQVQLKEASENLREKEGELRKSQDLVQRAQKDASAENARLKEENQRALAGQQQSHVEKIQALQAQHSSLQAQFQLQLETEKRRADDKERDLKELQALYDKKIEKLGSEEKKALEALDKAQAGSQESERLKAQVASLQRDLGQAKQATAALTTQSEGLNQQVVSLTEELKSVKTQGTENEKLHRRKIQEFENELTKKSTEFSAELERLNQINAKNLTLAKQEAARLSIELETLRGKLREQASHGQQQSEESKKAVESLTAKLHEAEAKLRQNVEELRQSQELARHEQEKAAVELKARQEKIQALEKSQSDLQSQYAKKLAEMRSQQKEEKSAAEQSHQQELQELKKQALLAQERLTSVSEQLRNEYEAQLQQERRRVDDSQAQAEATKRQLEETRKRALASSDELKKGHQELARGLEKRLEEYKALLDSQLAKDSASHQQQIQAFQQREKETLGQIQSLEEKLSEAQYKLEESNQNGLLSQTKADTTERLLSELQAQYTKLSANFEERKKAEDQRERTLGDVIKKGMGIELSFIKDDLKVLVQSLKSMPQEGHGSEPYKNFKEKLKDLNKRREKNNAAVSSAEKVDFVRLRTELDELSEGVRSSFGELSQFRTESEANEKLDEQKELITKILTQLERAQLIPQKEKEKYSKLLTSNQQEYPALYSQFKSEVLEPICSLVNGADKYSSASLTRSNYDILSQFDSQCLAKFLNKSDKYKDLLNSKIEKFNKKAAALNSSVLRPDTVGKITDNAKSQYEAEVKRLATPCQESSSSFQKILAIRDKVSGIAKRVLGESQEEIERLEKTQGMSKNLTQAMSHLQKTFIHYPYLIQETGEDGRVTEVINQGLNPEVNQRNLHSLLDSQFLEQLHNLEYEHCSKATGPFYAYDQKIGSVEFDLYCGPEMNGQPKFSYLIPKVINGGRYYVGTTGTMKDHYWGLDLAGTEKQVPGKYQLFRHVRPSGQLANDATKFQKEKSFQVAENKIQEQVEKNEVVPPTKVTHATSIEIPKTGAHENETHQLSMVEYAGLDLEQARKANRFPTPEQKNQCIQNVLEQLKKLHAFGILSRDIKPQNILFNYGDVENPCRMIDFGAGVMIDPKTGVVTTAGLNFTEKYSPYTAADNSKAAQLLEHEKQFMQRPESERKVPPGTTLAGVSQELSKKGFQLGDKYFLDERMDLYQTGYVLTYLMASDDRVSNSPSCEKSISQRRCAEKLLDELKVARSIPERYKILEKIESNLLPSKPDSTLLNKCMTLLLVAGTIEPRDQQLQENLLLLANACLYLPREAGYCSQWRNLNRARMMPWDKGWNSQDILVRIKSEQGRIAGRPVSPAPAVKTR